MCLRLFRQLSFLLLLIALVLSADAAFGQVRPTAAQVSLEKKMIDGKKYQLLGDFAKAESMYRAIVEEDVNNTAAYYELSRTLTAVGKSQDALGNIRKAVRLEPDNEWYLLMEADIHEKIGDLHSAMDIYERLIRLRPDRPHYYEMLISFSKKTNDHERLLKVLDQYETITGINESITRTRFETLDMLGRTDEALATIHRMTELFPGSVDYKFLAASYCKTKGMDEKANEYYRQVLAIDPADSRARLALAGTQKGEGKSSEYLQSVMPIMTNPSVKIDIKLQELIPYVLEFSEKKDGVLGNTLLEVTRQLVATHPKDAKAYAIQADVLAIFEKNQEAIQSYMASTQLNGNAYIVWEQLIRLLIHTHQYDEVLKYADEAIDIFPNQSYLYYAAGFANYKKKRFVEALDHLNQALVMTGKNIHQKISVYNVLGLVYDELGQSDKSVEAFETALSINPKNAETLSQYSLVLSRRIEQSEKAVAMADKVLTEGNHSAIVYQWIAEVFYNQKKFEKAGQSIKKAIDAGTDAYGYNLAGDILIALGQTDEAVEMWQSAINNGFPEQEAKKKIAEHKAQ